jgi:zinc transporter, ZIP family
MVDALTVTNEILGWEILSITHSAIMSIIIASAFIIGSIVAVQIKYSSKIKGDFSAFAAGIFFAAIAFSLITESTKLGHSITMILGFVFGAVVYSVANQYLKKRSKYKKSLDYEKDKKEDNTIENKREIQSNSQNGSSQNVIVGTILDSVPETLFIGVIIAMQLPGLIGAVIALFLGNLAATLYGAKLMVEQGLSKSKIIKEWLGDFVLVASAGPIGYYLVNPLSKEHLSIIVGFAAGTLMIFISKELIPEAYKKDNGYAIDIALVAGFLITYLLFYYL